MGGRRRRRAGRDTTALQRAGGPIESRWRRSMSTRCTVRCRSSLINRSVARRPISWCGQRDRAQPGLQPARHHRVVERDHGDVRRDPQARLLDGLVGAERDAVVEADEGGGSGAREQVGHGGAAALRASTRSRRGPATEHPPRRARRGCRASADAAASTSRGRRRSRRSRRGARPRAARGPPRAHRRSRPGRRRVRAAGSARQLRSTTGSSVTAVDSCTRSGGEAAVHQPVDLPVEHAAHQVVLDGAAAVGLGDHQQPVVGERGRRRPPAPSRPRTARRRSRPTPARRCGWCASAGCARRGWAGSRARRRRPAPGPGSVARSGPPRHAR